MPHSRAVARTVEAGKRGPELERPQFWYGRTGRSTCTAPAQTPARSTTSPKRSTERPAFPAPTTPRPRTTTCWCRASGATATRSGYFGYAYYAENMDKLKLVGCGLRPGMRVPYQVWRAIADGSYSPLSRPLFIYVSKNEPGTRPEVREFVEVLHGTWRRTHRRGRLRSTQTLRSTRSNLELVSQLGG